MGGRGSSSQNGASKKISSLEGKLDSVKSQLATIVREHGSAIGLPDKYYKLQKQRQAIEGKIRKENDKIMRNKKTTEGATKRTFVNGFGEATTREITSASYKRAQARLNKEIESRMRGRRW